MIAFIDDHREAYGVEPICRVLPIAPSTYHAHAARRADPGKLPARARSDAALMVEIPRVFEANFAEGLAATRPGGDRGGPLHGRPADADHGAAGHRAGQEGVHHHLGLGRGLLDRVNRQFKAPRPNALWVSDFTYVATWAGFVYIAFVIDAYARRIVGWRVSRTAHAAFVLDALETGPARTPTAPGRRARAS